MPLGGLSEGYHFDNTGDEPDGGGAREMPDLIACASRNREVFEDVLEAYVSTKLEQTLSHLAPRARSG